MKRSRFSLGVSAAAAVLVAALCVQTLAELAGAGDSGHLPVPEEYADRITVHENGDFTYGYTADELELDGEAMTLYAPGLLNIFPEGQLTRQEKRALARQAGGTVVSDISGDVNLLQVYVEGAGYAELAETAAALRGADGVMDAGCEVPAFVSSTAVTAADEPDTNPWASGGSEPNEDEPSGSNWGVEAIGAYTAWQYEQWCQDVTVGVIDSGFCLEHEDMGGNTHIQMLPGYEANTPSNHGSQVAGIIAAADNDIGLRGVASGPNHQLKVYCIDWNPQGDSGPNIKDTAQIYEMYQVMLQQGVRVINNSFGFNDISFNAFWNNENHRFGDLSAEETANILQQAIRESTRRALNVTLQMIRTGKPFLIVQSAANGVDNGGRPSLAENAGYFAGITEAYYEERYPGGYNGIGYTELDRRILIVGAVENKRTEDGDYVMTSYSNYGAQVDLCAPGQDIYTISDDPGGYDDDFYGTSAAAPMVAGAAALLWSIDPDLEPAEVWELLVDNYEYRAVGTRDNGHPVFGSEGSYPMLNIGSAVRTLMERKNEELVTQVRVTDRQTGEPVAGAEVLYFPSLWAGPETAVTDADGCCSFAGATDQRPCPAESYALVRADGMIRWYGTLYAWPAGDPAAAVNEIELDLYNGLDAAGDLLDQLRQDLPELADEAWDWLQTLPEPTPEPQATAAPASFHDTLAELAARYGVVATGEELYPEADGYGGGEELVDAQRLTGLLGADAWDYDGDGQDELFTVRLDTGAPAESGWGETRFYLTMYEWDEAAGQAVAADEQSFAAQALTNSLTNSAFHLARGEVGGQRGLYLTYSWEMNSCTFGVLRIRYDGSGMEVTGGVECNDYHGAFNCYDALASGAIDTLMRSDAAGADSNGWTLLYSDRFEGQAAPEAESVYRYRDSYSAELAAIGLLEPGLPGLWMSPDRPQGNDRDAAADAAAYDRQSIVRKPADRYIVSDGQLTTLCGVWHLGSNALLNTDLTLHVYDEGGLLDAWR